MTTHSEVIEQWRQTAHEIEWENKVLREQTDRLMEETQLTHAFLAKVLNEQGVDWSRDHDRIMNMSQRDLDRIERKAQEITAKQRAQMGTGFTSMVNSIQADMGKAQARRDDEQKKRTRMLIESAHGRKAPFSNARLLVTLEDHVSLVITGWSYGEQIGQNPVWFLTKELVLGSTNYGQVWIWSGSFEAQDIGNIPQIAYIEEIRAVQREMGITEDGIVGPQTMAAMKRNNFGDEISRVMGAYKSYSSGGFTVSKPTKFQEFSEKTNAAAKAKRVNPYAETEKRDQEKERERAARKNALTHDVLLLRRTLDNGEVPNLYQPGDTIVVNGRRFTAEDVERTIQSNLAYHLIPAWWGFYVVVDDAWKGKWHIWRPTKAIAERTGHKALEKQVQRRRRSWEIAHPKLVTAKDRWIVEPTQAEQTAKETAEWDAQFKSAEEGKK